MSLWMAYRFLKGNYIRVLFPLIGVIVATISLIMTISLGGSAKRIIENDLSAIGKNRVILGGGELDERDLEYFEKFEFVEYAMFPEKRDEKNGNIFRAYGDKALFAMGLFPLKENEIILDEDQFPNIKVGELIELTTKFGKRKFLVKKLYREESPFETMKVGKRIIMGNRGFEKSFGRGFYRNLVVSFHQGEDGEMYIPSLLKELNRNRYYENKIKILETPAVYKKIERVRGFVSRSLLVLSTISIIIGGVGVINLIGISIKERGSHIGMLRSMGIKKKQIIEIFLIEGMIVVTSGGVIGMILGVLVSILIGFLLKIPPKFDILKMLSVFAIIMGSGVVFGLIPARRAGNLEIVEALKNK